MRWFPGVAAALTMMLAVCCGATSRDAEFDVSFGTRKPLGLKLDRDLTVIGFQRTRSDTMGPAEANGWIKLGDKLVAVNEERVERADLRDVVRKIGKGAPCHSVR